jgi:hypothetical protein
MAIEEYTGVTKLDDNYYEVTSVVLLDEVNSFTVGDMADCTFVAKTGGVLKFLNGSSTFTNCTFLELSDAWNVTADQYYLAAPNNPRFLSPNGFIFKGCSWVLCQPNCAWVTATIGEYNFLVDDFGEPCRVKQLAGNNAGANIQVHSSDAELKSTITGLVFDVPYVVTLEQSTDTVRGIRIKDNDPGNFAQANLGFQIQTWDPDYPAAYAPYGTRQRFYEIEARCVNVQLAETATRPDERAVVLVDPIGRILKTTDTASFNGDFQRGILETWRTLSGNFIDILTKEAIDECRTVVTKDSDSELQLDETSDSFSVELKQLEQGLNSQVVVEDGDYTAKFLAYGYDLQSRSITIGDTTNPKEYDQGGILLFADSNITERNKATVDAYTDLLTTTQIYDRIKSFEVSVPTQDFGTNFVTVSGSGDTLDFGDKDVYFGDYGGTMVTYFDSDYVTPVGKPVGEASFSGYSMESTTAITSDTLLSFSRFDFANYGTWGALILKNIDVSPDGTKMLMAFNSSSDGGTYIAQLTMSTPFDVTTATKDNVVKLPNNANQYNHVTIDHGKYVTVAQDSASGWFFYEFATPYDISSARTDTSGSGTWGSYNAYNFAWSHDGTHLYKFQNNSTMVFRYVVCSTPWDLSTASGQNYVGTSNADLSGEHTTSVGGNQYQRWQGISMRWIDDNTVFLASGSTGKYTIITTATSNFVTAAEIEAATMLDIPSTGEIGWATISGQEIYSFDPASAGATTLNYTIDHAQASGSVELVGAPNSLFIQSSSVSDGGSEFTTIKTTGYFYAQGLSTIDTVVQDASGVGTTVTIKGINPNTEVRMYRVSDDSEIAGIENSVGNQATLAYNFVNEEDTYIIVHNAAYVTSPSMIEFTTQAPAAIINVFQSIDRAFSNPT